MSDKEKNPEFLGALLALQARGYTVKMVNETAQKFNQKYRVYQETVAGDKVIVVDEKGRIVGMQG